MTESINTKKGAVLRLVDTHFAGPAPVWQGLKLRQTNNRTLEKLSALKRAPNLQINHRLWQ